VLVLDRRVGESICLGDDVTITVLELRNNGKVVLGFVAPRIVEIDREEVRIRIRTEGRRGKRD
jgi:carbon storage regulator